MTALLSPLSALYGAAIALRNRWLDRPGGARKATLPVISVGNLSTGGTGKTPVVRWLAEALSERQHTVAIVSRGYGGKAGKGPLLASRGAGALATAERIGDEPWMLAEALPGVLLIVGSDRCAGAALAASEGASVVLLDDGFQHRRLARDLDIVLLDQTRPFWRDRLLPQGRLREPTSSLRRGDAFIVTRSDLSADREEHEAKLRALGVRGEVYGSNHRPAGFFNPSGEERPTPRRAVAFCGIGNPHRFRDDLKALGVELVAFHPFRDHQTLPPQRLRSLAKEAAKAEATLLTTEKDLARLGDAAQGVPLLTLRISLHLPQQQQLIEQVEAAIRRRQEGDR